MTKKKIMKYIYILLSVFITIILLGYLYLLCITQQRIILKNNSNELIESFSINYCDEVLSIDTMKASSSFSKRISVNSDCDFDVKITFSSGDILEENNLGYITGEDGSDSIFIITEDKKLNFSQEY